jgi:FkbM family methyltransferase
MGVTLGIRVRSWKRSKKVVGVINDTVKPTLRRLNYLTHRFVSKSLTCAKLCVRLRNQANCIVGYHLGESPDSAMNGEYRLSDFLAPRCKAFIDVGANVGDWTERFLRVSPARGILFEPSERCAALLREKFKNKPITLRNVAVGEKSGFIRFVEEENFSHASASAQTYAPSEHPGEVVVREVPMVKLDDELQSVEFNIDFVKIDTEGFDLRVLKGAESALRDRRIKFVQFEYNSHWIGTGSSLKEAKDFLESVSFDLFLIRSTGLHPLNYSYWGEYFRYSNFLACHFEDKHLLGSLLGPQV